MSTVEDVLEHVGVKGMHWGVRRAQKKAAKADAKWQANIYSVHGAVAVHNHVADQMNNGLLDKLNNNPKYKNSKEPLVDENGPASKLGRQYMHDYTQLNAQATAKAVREIHGTSPSGQFKARLDTSNKNQWSVVVSKVDAQHADAPWEDLVMEVDHDEIGRITDVHMIKDNMSQSQDVLEFLSHVGVKGMHWGVRRSKPTAKEQKIRSSREKVLNRRRQLSESDLKKFIERLDNEKKLKTLIEQDLKPGKSAAKRIMSESGQKVVKTVIAGAGLYTVKSILEKKFDPKEAAKFLAPAPKNK